MRINLKLILKAVPILVVLSLIGGYFIWKSMNASPAKNTPTSSHTFNASILPEGWKLAETKYFTVALPPDWKFNEGRGIDSYVGSFENKDVVLEFDFGMYSNSLAAENDLNYDIKYETVDSYNAKIVTPKVTGSGLTGIYFGDLWNHNKLNIYGKDLSNYDQQIAMQIISTVRFIKN